MKIAIFPLLAAMLLPLSACGGSPYYTAAPIEAWVIDAETNQPIEGAVVVANWQLVVGSLDGQRYKGQLEVKETVTDKAGRFYFEGFTKANPMLYELRNEDPKIIIFKPGYEYKKIVNNYPRAGTETPGTHRKAGVSGETVKLENLKAVRGVYGDSYYDFLGGELETLVEDCEWKKMPRMILAMEQEKKRLKSLYPKAYVNVLTINLLERRCGSAVEFFREYSK